MANNPQKPSNIQFRPVIHPQQGQPFVPMTSQQFGHAGHAVPSSNVGMPVIQGQQLQYSQQMQQLTPRQSQPGHPVSSSQGIPMPYIQTNRPLTSVPQHAQQAVPHISNPISGLSGAPPQSSYTFAPSYGQQKDNANALPQHQHPPQMLAPPAGQPWSSSLPQSAAAVTPVQPAGVQSSGTASNDAATNTTNQNSASDWQEHVAGDGRRYYYNKNTWQSSWEKPLELMSPLERADVSTVWKEFTSSDGRKYYYNKVTQQSTWTIPEELKLAREQAHKTISQGMVSETSDTSNAAASSAAASTPANAASSNTLASNGFASSPSSITPIVTTDQQRLVSGLSGTSVSHSVVTSSTTGVEPSTVVTVSTAPTTVAGSSGVEASSLDSKIPSIVENQATHDSTSSVNGAPLQDMEERSGTCTEDELRSFKLAKTDQQQRQQRNSVSLLRSNATTMFPDGQHQQQMLSFSTPNPKTDSFLVDKTTQNAILSYAYHPMSGYNRNKGYSSGSMHGGLSGARGPFTPSQRMELEHQSLIYKYITANVAVPHHLLIPIRKTLDSAGLSSYSTALLRPNALVWGGFHLGYSNNTDPEPGRCRRTDGKKWRCSRDAVEQKYCERHVNRGRHRSRKPVEGQSGQALTTGGTTNSTTTTNATSTITKENDKL